MHLGWQHLTMLYCVILGIESTPDFVYVVVLQLSVIDQLLNEFQYNHCHNMLFNGGTTAIPGT